MDHVDITTGVIDAWDLLYNSTDLVDRDKETQVEVDNIDRTTSPERLFLKETYTPVLTSIAAGYYPLFGGLRKSCLSIDQKSKIEVTVLPRFNSRPVQKRGKQLIKQRPNYFGRSKYTKKIYLLVPETHKERLYVIKTTNARTDIGIKDNPSECIIKHPFKDMNKIRKKISDKAKEKENKLKTIPECSPFCAYVNSTNTYKNDSMDRPGSPLRSPVRSANKTITKGESTTTNKTMASTQRHSIKSPDRISLRTEDTKTKSPVRSSQQKTRINIYQAENHREDKTVKSPDRLSYASSKRSIESIIAEQKRKSPERERSPDLGRKGRIRITGRLGLTEDDQCVLKCDATLDDKPIPTEFRGAACAMLPSCFQCDEDCRGSPRKQRDAKVQAKESPVCASFRSRSETGKESQATQVDFQMMYSTSTTRKNECGRGKVKQQCACVNTIDDIQDVRDAAEDTVIGVKKNHSPVIIISVYPRNETGNDDVNEIKQKQIKTSDQKKDKKPARSRSPSPSKSSKKAISKKSDSHVNASTSKKTVRETARKETKSKVNQSQSRSVIRSTTVTKSKTESKRNKKKSQKYEKTPPQSARYQSPQAEAERANETELMKRQLIEDFTRSYTEQINKNAHFEIPIPTKHNVSNITIDIEGDSDYYNVKLEQDGIRKLNTEMTVRKPNTENRRNTNGEKLIEQTDTTSLENFLYMPGDEPRKRSFSQTLMFDGTELTMKTDRQSGNELNVKDSIEISHRRENRSSVIGSREENKSRREVDAEHLAKMKHFQGDECSVSDPDSRDREIRKLLGIEKGVEKNENAKSQVLGLPRLFLGNVLAPGPPVDICFGAGRIYNTGLRQVLQFDEYGQVVLQRASQSYSGPPTAAKTVNFAENDTKNSLHNANETVILIHHQMMDYQRKNYARLFNNIGKPVIIGITRRYYVKIKRKISHKLTKKRVYSNVRWCRNEQSYRGQRTRMFKTLHYDKDSQTDKALIEKIYTTNDTNTYTVKDVETCGNFSCGSTSSKNDKCTQNFINYNNIYMHNVLRTVYIATENTQLKSERVSEDPLFKTASVRSILTGKMDVKKQKVKFTSSDLSNYTSGQVIEKKDSGSVHTIFKCHKKSITPNLGASATSLSDVNKQYSKTKFFEDSLHSIEIKTKKPFLRRLMSCLVFIASQSSETEKPKVVLDSGTPISFDSYHIGTSLNAMEMSSSVYDTSDSFYSDHAAPTTQTRRGFFSSVRGLISRKN